MLVSQYPNAPPTSPKVDGDDTNTEGGSRKGESEASEKDVGNSSVWSLGGGHFGDPDGTTWIPKFCDPQLCQEHVWFWEPNLKVRSLAMMIPIYHDIVGRGMVMEL